MFQFYDSHINRVSIPKNSLDLSNCDDQKFDRKKDEEANEFIPFIIDNSVKSEVISLLGNIKIVMESCCQNTFNSVVKCEDVFEVAKRTLESKVEWKKERKYRVTGSRYVLLLPTGFRDFLLKSDIIS